MYSRFLCIIKILISTNLLKKENLLLHPFNVKPANISNANLSNYLIKSGFERFNRFIVLIIAVHSNFN